MPVRNPQRGREKILQGPVPQWESEEHARLRVRATRKLPRVARRRAERSSARGANAPDAAAIRGSQRSPQALRLQSRFRRECACSVAHEEAAKAGRELQG